MQLKSEGGSPCQSVSRTYRRTAMPVDSLILSAAIVGAFVVFGAVLYWGERRTRDLTPDAPNPKSSAAVSEGGSHDWI
jgi:hypothetical protein